MEYHAKSRVFTPSSFTPSQHSSQHKWVLFVLFLSHQLL